MVHIYNIFKKKSEFWDYGWQRCTLRRKVEKSCYFAAKMSIVLPCGRFRSFAKWAQGAPHFADARCPQCGKVTANGKVSSSYHTHHLRTKTWASELEIFEPHSYPFKFQSKLSEAAMHTSEC